MTETLLEKPVCQNCHADVRPGALFCYSCGSSVAAADAENTGNNGKTRIRLREEYGREEKFNSGRGAVTEEKPIDKPSEDPFALPVRNRAEVQNRNLAGEDQAQLKSAAQLRRKNRAAEKKKVEIVWEPPQDSSNLLFILASLLLLLTAILILMAMLYLR